MLYLKAFKRCCRKRTASPACPIFKVGKSILGVDRKGVSATGAVVVSGVKTGPNPAVQPVTIALNNLSGTYSVDWNVVVAGALVAALPTLLIYIFLGRFFIQGIMAGSVKG